MSGLPIPGSTLAPISDAYGFTLPRLPPNHYFDDPATVDESLERCSPASKHLSHESPPWHLPAPDTKTYQAAPTSTAPSRAHAPTTEEIVQLIMIDEVRTAEERLDADQRALERKTEMFENAWRADRMALNQERQTLAVQRQEQERKSIDLARWASALAEGRLNLHNEQAIFRQQRAEAEQEQEKKTIGLARWESALAKARLDLHNEQAIFRQQRVEAEQEQYHPRLLRTRELIWAASEEELLSILNTVRYRLATRGSSTNAPEQITRPPRLP